MFFYTLKVEKMQKEKTMEEQPKKDLFTPKECLELLICVVAPLWVFLYLVLGTDMPRYFALFCGLLIPWTIRIRGEEDHSSRKEVKDWIKGLWLLLIVIVAVGLIGLLIYRWITSMGNLLENKPMIVISILLTLILIYLIKIYNQKKW